MGLDARLIAAAGQVPNIARSYIEAEQAGIKTGMIDNELRAKDKLAQFAMNMPKGANVADYYTQGGFPEQGLEYAKKQAEIDKTKADAGKTELESHLKMLDISSRFNQGLMAMPQLSKQAIMTAAANYAQQGFIKPEHVKAMEGELANVPDNDAALRQIIDRHMQMGLEAKDKLSAAIQMRGQDITAQNNQFSQGMRAKEFGLDQDKFSYNKDADAFEQKYKVASLERQIAGDEFSRNLDSKKYQLELDKYNNPAKASKPTEAQSKAALYANRMQEAENVLSSLDYSPAAIGTKEALSNTPLIGGVLGAGANMALSKDSQQAIQAQRNFVNAVLRRESGAVISPSEFDNAKKQYFPEVGDSTEVLAQKEQNRKTAIQALQAESQGTIPEMTKNTGGATSTWDDNKILQKFGGTPEQLAKFKALKGKK